MSILCKQIKYKLEHYIIINKNQKYLRLFKGYYIFIIRSCSNLLLIFEELKVRGHFKSPWLLCGPRQHLLMDRTEFDRIILCKAIAGTNLQSMVSYFFISFRPFGNGFANFYFPPQTLQFFGVIFLLSIPNCLKREKNHKTGAFRFSTMIAKFCQLYRLPH